MLKALLDFLLRRKSVAGLEQRHATAIASLAEIRNDAHEAHEATMAAIDALSLRAKRVADVRDAVEKHLTVAVESK